jgi:hypothetical protein
MKNKAPSMLGYSPCFASEDVDDDDDVGGNSVADVDNVGVVVDDVVDAVGIVVDGKSEKSTFTPHSVHASSVQYRLTLYVESALAATIAKELSMNGWQTDEFPKLNVVM